MRFALLGTDEDALFFRRMFAAAPDHDLFTVQPSDWESLMARNDCDAVIVTHRQDELLRVEQLKKLVAAGVTVVATHPVVDVLTAYELEMIRRENQGVLVPFAPGWKHPAWDRLRKLVTSGNASPLGNAEQISFERFVEDRSRTAVLIQLTQDVGVLRRLIGDITSVNAMGVHRDDDSWSSLTVHFTSESGCSGIWSIAAPGSDAETRVRIAGSQGTSTVVIPEDSNIQFWSFSDRTGQREEFDVWSDALALVEQLRLTKQGQPPNPSWSDACLDLEIAESAEKSLRRKRSIDLHTSERSEEKTFKGFMAAAGCLVLMAILLAFLGFALWDGFRSPFREAVAPHPSALDHIGEAPSSKPGRWSLWARLWPVYPLLAFLLLQFLLFITRRTADEPARDAGS